MKEFFHSPTRPFSVSPGVSAAELLARMGGTSFQARNLAQGTRIWAEMLEDEVTIFFGLAGAMIPAGMRRVMVYLIENRLIDCLVSTGANLFHDFFESLGKYHWQGTPQVNDQELGREKINRIYDIFASEDEYARTDEFITELAGHLNPDRPYTTREFLYRLGLDLTTLAREEGVLTSAAKAGVPIYCPAIGDSVFGMALANGRVKGQGKLLFDVVQDVIETAQIALAAKATGLIYVGGGTPKNFIQQTQITPYIFGKRLEGHKYAVQVTTDFPQFGGSSGCTFEESRSWRKVKPRAHSVTINCDATIALPLLVSALAESSAQAIKKRKKPTFDPGRQFLFPESY